MTHFHCAVTKVKKNQPKFAKKKNEFFSKENTVNIQLKGKLK